MVVAQRGVVTNSGNPTTGFTLVIPAATQTGDDLYVFFVSRDHTSGTALATCTDNDTGGNTWTLKHNPADRKTMVFWKKATSGTASKTITIAGCVGSSCGGVIVFSGGRGGDPTFDIVTESNSAGDESHASFTPTNADSMVVMAIFNVANDETVSNAQWATLGAVGSNGFQVLSTGGSDSGVAVVAKAQSGGPSAVGNFTWSQTNNTVRTVQFTIAPFEAKTGTVTATGGGVATVTQTTVRTNPVTATGGGVATVTQKTVRTNAVTATGGGTATVLSGKTVSATLTATGGGSATTTGSKKGLSAQTATGGGSCSTSGSHYGVGSLTGTGGGVASLSSVAGHTGSATATGGGVASVSATSSRFGSVGGTGGGVATLTGAHVSTGSVTATGGGVGSATGRKQGLASVTVTGGGTVTIDYLVGMAQIGGSVEATGGGSATVVGVKAALTTIGATGGGSASVSGFTARFGVVVATGGGVATLEIASDAVDVLTPIGEILDVPASAMAAWFIGERSDPSDVMMLASSSAEAWRQGRYRYARRLATAARLLEDHYGPPQGEIAEQIERTTRVPIRVQPRR